MTNTCLCLRLTFHCFAETHLIGKYCAFRESYIDELLEVCDYAAFSPVKSPSYLGQIENELCLRSSPWISREVWQT
jgi:hypothetical protein